MKKLVREVVDAEMSAIDCRFLQISGLILPVIGSF